MKGCRKNGTESVRLWKAKRTLSHFLMKNDLLLKFFMISLCVKWKAYIMISVWRCFYGKDCGNRDSGF